MSTDPPAAASRQAGSRRRARRGLKRLLLSLLLPGVLVSLAIDSYNDYQTLSVTVRDAYDRALLTPIRMLERSIVVGPDEVSVNAPWYAWGLLESLPEDRMFYGVQLLGQDPENGLREAIDSGRHLFGMQHLSVPEEWPDVPAETVLFYDGAYRQMRVRVAAVLRHLVYEGRDYHLLVQVAQYSEARNYAESRAWQQEMIRDARAVLVVGALVWLGITWGLRPLARLRADVEARAPDDTTPLAVADVPTEVAPLVEAINHHIARHQTMVAAQSQFLADASHQLRTPLAIMLTQAEYALREADPVRARESLEALVARLRKTQRLAGQLLGLAEAQHAPRTEASRFDLASCAREVLITYLNLAHSHRIDLGWDDTVDAEIAVLVRGHQDGIREALSNLVDNAIRYTPSGGRITLAVGRDASGCWAAVTDNGPGIPREERERVFQRFVRSHAGLDAPAPGTGLGLAIVRAFVQRDGGTVHLEDGEPGPQGVGVRAVLHLPCAYAAVRQSL